MLNIARLPIFLLIFASSGAHAVAYYQSKGGVLIKINEETFKSCTSVVYRASGKDDLPAAFKRKALNAVMRGDVVNEATAAATAAKATDGTCTYSEKDDLK